MQFSGYIEGYYGKIFSWQQRHEIVSHCSKLGLNSYLLAPKEDHYHRVGWRETPPNEYLDEMQQLLTESKAKGVTIIPAIAPGLSFDFTSEEDIATLCSRIEQFCSCGAETVALLMDDIPLELPKASQERYNNLAEAQLELLNHIEQQYKITLLFCPTVYTNQLIDCDDAAIYLDILAKNLSSNVYLFWTGEHTIAERIDATSCQSIAERYPDRLIFWDNYYSNDYCPTRLFVGPYEGRDRQFISDSCAGVMINPTGLFHTDMLLLDLFAAWLKGATVSAEQWITVAHEYGVPQKYEKILPWFYGPYSPADAEAILEISDDPISFFTEFIVDWNSAMKLEWYPYLHNLFTEVKFLTGKTITGKGWYDLRFPPAHAKKLFSGSMK